MFKMFEVELGASLFHGEINDPCMRLVDVMHSGSPISVKNYELEQFSDTNNCLRILVATEIYGMGVDSKDVTRVIHAFNTLPLSIRSVNELKEFKIQAKRHPTHYLPS